MRKREEVEMVVREEEKTVREEQQKEQELKDEDEGELDKITPVYEAATQALESLSKAAVNEVFTFANPSEAVKRVIFAIYTLFGKETD